MKIQFLGTGAGEMWPATFCLCAACKRARKDRRIMPGSSILIDNQYLIDAPTGLGLNLALLGINVKFPFHIFITHSHQDHFDPEEVVSSRNSPDSKISFYASKTVLKLLKHYTAFNRFFNVSKFENYDINRIRPYATINVNREVAVVPVLASHDKTYNEENLNYIVKIKGRTLLYACDTGWYCDRTWKEVRKHEFDVVILECSAVNTRTHGRGHMDVDSFLMFIDKLKPANSIHAKTQVIATHFSLHDFDRKKIARLTKQGVKIAYRGMICRC